MIDVLQALGARVRRLMQAPYHTAPPLTAVELQRLASVLDWAVQTLAKAEQSQAPELVCSSCLTPSAAVYASRHVAGARCGRCAVALLDSLIDRFKREAGDAAQAPQWVIAMDHTPRALLVASTDGTDATPTPKKPRRRKKAA